MTAAERERLAALERQVAELQAEVRALQGEFVLRTLEEKAAAAGPLSARPVPRLPRPRHLHVVRGAR